VGLTWDLTSWFNGRESSFEEEEKSKALDALQEIKALISQFEDLPVL